MKESAIQIHEFMCCLGAGPLSDCHVNVIRWSVLQPYFSRVEMVELFGGYLQGVTPENTYLGVWGRRVCSRFRRLLREQGASVTRIEGLPHPDFKIKAQQFSSTRPDHV
jgi:hypothetical protein